MLISVKQNFISGDSKTARDSYGNYFTVGEVVGHQAVPETAKILRFTPDVESNEINAITDRGSAHLDFLIKLETTLLQSNGEQWETCALCNGYGAVVKENYPDEKFHLTQPPK